MQQSVKRLACQPLDTVRIGFIGLGKRGQAALERYMHLEGVEVKALCDLCSEHLIQGTQILNTFHRPVPDSYQAEDGWKQVCRREDVDLIYVCTDWLTHTDMAVYAMLHHKHVALEVPAAMTVADCWRLVDTAEQTQRHCMMLENCCYDAYALTTLNMAQLGVFGEITHVEGSYIHDLREHYFEPELRGKYANQWMREYSRRHTGNPYPTHGLGPVCQWLGIHQGDRLDYLVSMSSKQAGLTDYAMRTFGSDSVDAKQDYEMGDVNSTLIRTVKGRTILLQYDVVTPRPYSRHQMICGTRGFMQKYPIPCVMLDEKGKEPLSENQLKELMEEYRHPFTRRIGEEARVKGVQNEMNYIMDYRLVECLRNGWPLDQDVYDAALWSCSTQLSEESVRKGSVPVQIPDFTRGHWEE